MSRFKCAIAAALTGMLAPFFVPARCAGGLLGDSINGGPAPANQPGPANPPAPAMAPPAANNNGTPKFVPGTPLIGDVDTAPAPSWLKPGMRLTFYLSSATIQNSSTDLAPANPGDPGAWYDPNSQQWFTSRQNQSIAADGFLETQFVAIANGKVYFTMRNLTLNRVLSARGALSITSNNGGLCPIGNDGDAWVSPAILQAQREVRSPNLYIARGSIADNGRTIPTLVLQMEGKSNVYDLDSGVTLLQSTRYESQGPGGTTSIGSAKFLKLRETAFPWLGKPAPDWVRTAKMITYKFEKIENSTVTDRTIGPHVTTGTGTYKVLGRGGDWFGAALLPKGQESNPAAQPVPGSLAIAGAASSSGAMWLPPTGLTGLQAGQTLDTDPITNMVTTVTRFGTGPNGAPIVALLESCPAYQCESDYDTNSGLLVYQQVDIQTTIYTTTHIKRTCLGVQ